MESTYRAFLIDHGIENLLYGLHSTLWMLDKDVQTPRSHPSHRSVYCVTPKAWKEYTQRHTTVGWTPRRVDGGVSGLVGADRLVWTAD